MINVAPHMHITGLQMTDDDVDRRNSGVSDLAAAYAKIADVGQIFRKVGGIAMSLHGDGIPPPDLSAEVDRAIQPHASSFVSSERPLEVGIYSGLAVLSIVDNDPRQVSTWTIPDVYAAALWSALGFQPALADAKRERLRHKVLAAARDRTLKSAELARERSSVSDFMALAIGSENLAELSATFKQATDATIEALRRNAALDREELDFLWWAMLGRSRLLKEALCDVDEPTRLVFAGIEAADNLRRLPCDVHRELLLRSVVADDEFDLGELISALAERREILVAKFLNTEITEMPTVFPLLCSIASTNDGIAGALVKRRASEWGSRALLEAGLWHMRSAATFSL